MSGTKQEQTGWRDMELSLRHRDWGRNCPCVDIDFLVVEYNYCKPCALIDFKTIDGFRKDPDEDHNVKTMINMCEGHHEFNGSVWVRKPMACAIVKYDKNPWRFRVEPLNDRARKHYVGSDGRIMTEQQFVRSIIRLRKYVLLDEDEAAIAKLNDSDKPNGSQHDLSRSKSPGPAADHKPAGIAPGTGSEPPADTGSGSVVGAGATQRDCGH